MTMIEKLRLKEEIDARNEEAIAKWSRMTHGKRYQLEVETYNVKRRFVQGIVVFCVLISALDPILIAICIPMCF